MVNGVLTAEIFLPGATSLKEKRRTLKSLVEKLRGRFNVAVAEVEGQNAWQRATLAVAAVAGESVILHRLFEEVVDFIDGYRDAVLSDYQVDLYGVYLGREGDSGAKKVVSGGLVLVTGGARSGKSAYAQSLLQDTPRAVFIATAVSTDAEMAARIAAHRSRRPASWETIEEPRDLAGAVRSVPAGVPVLVDCLGFWVNNLLAAGCTEEEVLKQATEFIGAVGAREGLTVAVTNEVGGGVVPPYPLGRLYRDLLGRVNQVVAHAAVAVYLLVCGIPVRLKP